MPTPAGTFVGDPILSVPLSHAWRSLHLGIVVWELYPVDLHRPHTKPTSIRLIVNLPTRRADTNLCPLLAEHVEWVRGMQMLDHPLLRLIVIAAASIRFIGTPTDSAELSLAVALHWRIHDVRKCICPTTLYK